MGRYRRLAVGNGDVRAHVSASLVPGVSAGFTVTETVATLESASVVGFESE